VYTYQDFAEDFAHNAPDAVMKAIKEHQHSYEYRKAVSADNYNKQQNETAVSFVKWLYDLDGKKTPDSLASNHKLCSNFFRRLNVQRATYSMGNGINFDDVKGGMKGADVKKALGMDIDTRLFQSCYDGLIHGESFLFFNNGKVVEFKLTEFVPLIDELSGALSSGIRFWQLDSSKPMVAILYEEDGYTRYETDEEKVFREKVGKKAYKETATTTKADEEAGIPPEISEENYGMLPIVPFWGSRLHQSTLVGMQAKIDAYDLIQSGFANDLSDCSEIYWLVSGAGGMRDSDLARFRDRLKLNHIASVPKTDDASINPYTQEIPYAARKELLENLRASIYEDFGGMDVHTVSAGSTNDHIDAAYQPMDENADDFEYQIIVAVQQLLRIAGMDGDIPVPKFKRNRISNQKEIAEMIMLFAEYLPDDIILSKAPFLSADEVQAAIEQRAANEEKRITTTEDPDENEEDE